MEVSAKTEVTRSPMDQPIPLSFPAILRNPGLTDRYAHLTLTGTDQERFRKPVKSANAKSQRRHDNIGKRWVQRKNNAHFTGNPHIVVPTKSDYAVQVPGVTSTFPKPLPSYLPRNSKVPSIIQPECNPHSADAGRFTLSLKGMRRELRNSGFRAELLVRDIETEIDSWLHGGIIMSPNAAIALNIPGSPIGTTETITEVSRTPLQLVWSVNDDAFARYVIHCCARFHEIISFSKEVSGQRLTYLLRPNTRLPNYHAATSLETPPATDLDFSSQLDSESDFLSDSQSELGAESDIEVATGAHSHLVTSTLPDISEMSLNDETWSLIDETDVDGDLSESDAGLAESVTSLSLHPEDPDRTLHVEPHTLQSSPARARWTGRGRSTSSPSRSPARRQGRRRANAAVRARNARSFYEYLFS